MYLMNASTLIYYIYEGSGSYKNFGVYISFECHCRYCSEEQNDTRLLYLIYIICTVSTLVEYLYNVLFQFREGDDLFVFVRVHVEIFVHLKHPSSTNVKNSI